MFSAVCDLTAPPRAAESQTCDSNLEVAVVNRWSTVVVKESAQIGLVYDALWLDAPLSVGNVTST